MAQIVDEVCDGVDDDCDGEVDEGELGAPLVSDCYEGPGGTEDVGFCEGGLRTCDGGDFGACAGQVLPAAEGCAAEDRDCDGQLDNGPTPALAPNGAGARAHLSPGHDFGIGDFTLEAWVMRSGDSPDLSETVLRQDGSGDTGTLALLLAGDGGTPLARVIVDGETTEVAGGQGVAAGVWTHLAVERWAGSLWLYVGGAAAGSAEIPGELRIDPQGNALQFGARSAGAERLSGAVDEVRLTRGARYRGDAFLPSERLVADARTAHLWRFSEGAGAVAADTVAAGGRNLVVEGASWRAAGVPDRRVFYSDGDGDGVGAGGAVILSCAEPPPVEDWAEVLGDCDDESDAVGAAVFEVLGNQVDDDCDGRLDDADGIRAMDLRDPGAYLSVGNARGFYLRNTDWTVEAWVKLDAYAVGAVAPLASNRYTVGQGANGWQIGVGGLGADAGNQRRLLFTLDDGAGEHTVASDRRVPLGSWTHVAVTFVEVQQLASLWINGKAAGDASLEVMPFGRTVMQIGRDHSLGDLDTHAVIDDLHFSTVLRYDAPFDPPVCAAADDDTLALWSFEEADGGASPQGAQAAREALLRGGAVRVAAACEGKAPPPASCESVIPGAAAVCRDLADGCVGRAALAGATCADWCAANGLTCDGAYVDDATCALGASIVNDCAGAAQEAICACSR